MESKALIGRKMICDHLQIGKRKFYKLIDMGAPIVAMEQVGWVSHKDTLDEFFGKTLDYKQSRTVKEACEK